MCGLSRIFYSGHCPSCDIKSLCYVKHAMEVMLAYTTAPCTPPQMPSPQYSILDNFYIMQVQSSLSLYCMKCLIRVLTDIDESEKKIA